MRFLPHIHLWCDESWKKNIATKIRRPGDRWLVDKTNGRQRVFQSHSRRRRIIESIRRIFAFPLKTDNPAAPSRPVINQTYRHSSLWRTHKIVTIEPREKPRLKFRIQVLMRCNRKILQSYSTFLSLIKFKKIKWRTFAILMLNWGKRNMKDWNSFRI